MISSLPFLEILVVLNTNSNACYILHKDPVYNMATKQPHHLQYNNRRSLTTSANSPSGRDNHLIMVLAATFTHRQEPPITPSQV